MKKLLSLLIGATVAIIVVAAVLVPIIDDAESKTVSVTQNVNARYSVSIGTDLAGDLVYTYVDDKPALNGDVLYFENYATRNIICSSDAFRLTQDVTLSAYTLWTYDTNATISQLKVNADLTYEYTTTEGTVVTIDSAVEHLFYAEDAGTLGAFLGGTVGASDTFWLDHNETVYVATGGTLSADGQTPFRYNGLWSADMTTIGGSWTPTYTKISSEGVWVDQPIDFEVRALTVNEGELANEYQFFGHDASATINGIEYSATAYNPVAFAPIEYHHRTASDNSIIGLLGAIPVLVIVGIMGYVARTALMDRRE